jgi:hypothetical protein
MSFHLMMEYVKSRSNLASCTVRVAARPSTIDFYEPTREFIHSGRAPLGQYFQFVCDGR